MKTDLFQSRGHCWIFKLCWHIEWSTLTVSSLRTWNSSAEILSLPLTLFVVMLPKAHLTWHSRMFGPRWVITPSWLSGSWRSFLYSSSVCSCRLFLISYASVGPLTFLSFIVPILTQNVPLASPVFLTSSPVFAVVLFSSVSLRCSFKKAFLSLLFSGTRHSAGCIFSPLPSTSLLFSAIWKPSSDDHVALLHFSFLGMVLLTASCTVWQTSVHSSSGTLSIGSNSLNLFLTSTVYSQGIWFRSYLNGLVVFPTFYNLSLNLAIRSSWSEPQSAPRLVFANCIELLHLWLQRL